MRIIKIVFTLCGILFFASCQKELSFERSSTTTGSNNTNAVYTLGTTGTSCTGIVVAGTYTNGVAVSAGNTVQIQVNVTTAGAYSITTAAVAGVSFSANGSFSNTGTQTVTLVASGKPTAEGVKTFSVAAGSNCNFDITFEKAAPPATFTFAGAPSACTLPLVNGTYTANTPVSVSNTVVIKVNVTTAGSYNIVTNIVNGLSFSASGVFTSTGTDIPVTLNAAGTPLAAGTTTLQFDAAATCSFDIPVKAATVATGIFSCKIDGVAATFTEMAAAGNQDPLAGTPYLSLNGYEDSNHDQQLEIYVSKGDQTAVGAGTYDEQHAVPTSATNLGYRIEIDLHLLNPDLTTTIWNTSSNIPPLITNHPAFTVIVTSVTATRVKGTFSGKLTNTLQGGTAFKTITEGVFDLPIQ